MPQFQYKPRTEEQWNKRAKGSVFDGYALDDFTTFSPKKENWIRILPPTWENPNHYGIDLWVHFSVGPNNGTIICLNKMKNQPCPVCQAFAKAEQQGREDAKDLKPTRRVLVWLLDRKEEKQPLLWAMAWTVDRDISKICRDRQTGELYQIDHPTAGYDLSFDKEGEQIQTKYTGFQLARKASPVDQKYVDYVVAHPLPSTLNWRTYEEVQALFEGQPVEAEKPVFETTLQSAPAAAAPPVASSAPPIPASPPPVATAPPPPPVVAAPPPPPKPFVSEWVGSNCTCGSPQYSISPTAITCEKGHVIERAIPGSVPGNGKSTAQAVVATTEDKSPPEGMFEKKDDTTAVAKPAADRASSLRQRFSAGKS